MSESKPATIELGELDRVRLKRSVDTEGVTLQQGLVGTIVLCHSTGFEVEFDGIADFFGVLKEDLEKI